MVMMIMHEMIHSDDARCLSLVFLDRCSAKSKGEKGGGGYVYNFV